VVRAHSLPGVVGIHVGKMAGRRVEVDEILAAHKTWNVREVVDLMMNSVKIMSEKK
jgi:hypothetical protein